MFHKTQVFSIFLFAIAISLSTGDAHAQQLPGAQRIMTKYQKVEVDIPMRDGVKLHTTIYAPRDTGKKYPIMLKRTPYGTAP